MSLLKSFSLEIFLIFWQMTKCQPKLHNLPENVHPFVSAWHHRLSVKSCWVCHWQIFDSNISWQKLYDYKCLQIIQREKSRRLTKTLFFFLSDFDLWFCINQTLFQTGSLSDLHQLDKWMANLNCDRREIIIRPIKPFSLFMMVWG